MRKSRNTIHTSEMKKKIENINCALLEGHTHIGVDAREQTGT